MCRWSRGVLPPDFFSGFGQWGPVPRGSNTEVTPDSREEGEAADTRGAGVLHASGAPQSPSDPLWGFIEKERMSMDLSVGYVCVSSLFLLSLESSRILSYLGLTTHTLGRILYWLFKHRKEKRGIRVLEFAKG